MNEQNASMDEILSSIRDIVKEEAGANDAPAAKKEAAPAPTEPAVDAAVSDDDIEAMMAAALEEGSDGEEDVLELTETVDDANNQAAPAEDMVDINAFAENGTQTAADASSVAAARAEYGEEQAEETPAEEPAVEAAPEAAPAPAPQAEAPKPAAPKAAPAGATADQVFLNAMPSAKGLQLAFPVEVLAEALRPLVKDWVAANLPDIVERLVREELSRLVDKK